MANMTKEEWLKKFDVPASKFDQLDLRRILAGFQTGYQWWWQKHPLSGKSILTYVHPATGLKVLPDQEWYSQDFSSFGQNYDASKTFFDQFRELQLKVPMLAGRNLIEPENSVAIGSYGDVNSYFSSGCENTKNSFFCAWSKGPERSGEIHNAEQVTNSFQIDDAFNIYNSRFVRDATAISNSAFVFYAKDLEYCFGASVQKHKKYLFFNKQLSKEQYVEEMKNVDLSKRSSVEEYKKRFKDLLENETIWPQNLNVKDEGSSGEYIISGVNCELCYSTVQASRDMYYCSHTSGESHDNAFCQLIHNVADSYLSADVANGSEYLMCHACAKSNRLTYCMQCFNCEDCFGCVGLNRKKFCILNKQYEQAEYQQKVSEIISKMKETKEYGEFFPLSFSPVYFGQSSAVLYYLASQEDGKKLGALDFDPESEGAIGDLSDNSHLRKTSDIPDTVEEMAVDDWVGVPILDEHAGRRFAFLRPELEFYKEQHIAPPNHHFVHRMQDMIQEANSAVFEDKNCDKCGKEMLVARNIKFNRKKIYCRACFDPLFE